MKFCIIIFLLILPVFGFSQTKLTGYLELRGTIDVFDDIHLNTVVKPKRAETKIDSLIDYKEINNIILKFKKPATILNALSAEGWTLISVIQVASNKDAISTTPFLLYYLRRDY